jgi:hypothetical protein
MEEAYFKLSCVCVFVCLQPMGHEMPTNYSSNDLTHDSFRVQLEITVLIYCEQIHHAKDIWLSID